MTRRRAYRHIREPQPPFRRAPGLLGDGWVCAEHGETLMTVIDDAGLPWLLHPEQAETEETRVLNERD